VNDSRVGRRKPLLVVGVPRSGTTWVARVLAQNVGTGYIEEPDNQFRFPYALRVKRRLGRGEYPALEIEESAPGYELLWARALSTGQGPLTLSERVRRRLAGRLLDSARAEEVSATIAGRSPQSVRLRAAERLAVPERPPGDAIDLVAKSVYAQLSLEWIAARFELTAVIVLRHPLNVLSSWRRMQWLDRTRNDMLDELDPKARRELAAKLGVAQLSSHASPLARAAWLFGVLTSSLLATAERRPEWHVVAHEQLCEQPHEAFRELFASLGLTWTQAAGDLLDELNRPGDGYEVARVAEELPDAWRSRLSSAEAEEALDVLEAFGVDDWLRPRRGSSQPYGEA
jgi:sulfotransferase family protein